MKKTLFFGLFGLVCFLGACKSESKEATSETATDTTTVAMQPGKVTLDSVALKEEEAKTPPVAAPKPASQPPKGQPAAKAPKAPAPKAEATMDAKDMEYNEFPSKRASYPGGVAALNKYLADNIKYPVLARENGIEGTVYANILVDEMGTIGDVTFPKPLGYGLEEEVLRVIKGMPKLIPAEDQSKPVKTKYILPVKFNLK